MDTRAAVDEIEQTTAFGHPKGLAFLFATEMWERFSYYGMRSLLVLYLVKYLLLPGHAEGVVGLATLKTGLEAVFGPLETQPFASQIYGLYGALVYLTPIFGGLLADRVLGQRRMVIAGAVLMATGHFLMAFEPLLLFALTALILGNGAFKPNISTQVGGLYAPGDRRRDRAYSIFYVGINLGAFLAPLVCGTLGERAGWHWGFGAAGVGMLIGLAIYLAGRRHLPADERTEAAKPQAHAHAEGGESGWRGLVALLVLFMPNVLFWAAYEQQGNTIPLWADAYTDRAIGLFGLGGTIPVTWFLAFNPLMIFLFTPALLDLWAFQAGRGREPSTITKMGIGCLLLALAYLVMAVAARGDGQTGGVSWLWLLLFFVLLTVGELYLSPIGLSLVSKIAPRSLLSLMMGVWLATSFLGNFLAGFLGTYWEVLAKSQFFLMIAAVACVAGLAILLASGPLRRLVARPL